MLAVLAQRTYRHLFLAQVVALVGTGLLTVALGLLAYELAGEAAGQVLGKALAMVLSDECEPVYDDRERAGAGRREGRATREGLRRVSFEPDSRVDVPFEVEVIVR